ncbi:MAG: efflux RND transporter permease subunit [Candidatus Latescibacter sp.]|nr:efflux RND transporter permease subunit [Candidatus Latescibacter sp.]
MRDTFLLYLLKNKIAIFLLIFMLAAVGYHLSGGITQGVFPNVIFPRVQVTIENGYAPIKQMLFQVTKPAEESIKTIQGVERVISNTSVGAVEINVYFDWSTDPYLAYQFVQARMAEIKNEIPPEARVSILQATPSRFPIAMYAIGSETVPRNRLTETLYYQLRPVMLSIKGIYNVEIRGPQYTEYKIVLNNDKIKSYNLSIDFVEQFLKEQNTIDFLGLIRDYKKQYVVSLYQKPESIDDIPNLKIPLPNGQYVSLSDIALTVEDHAPTTAMTAASGFKNSVVFNIIRQQNGNSREVVKEVDRKIAEFNKTLSGQNMHIRKYYDETDFIGEAIRSVMEAILLGTLIAALIVFLFLRKKKLSLFLIFIVPIVFLVTIIGIKIARYDFNIFSLGGMAAAVGGLIDHLVIIIENIERHYRRTGNKLEAVIEGSREILPIMTVATLISISIFLPLLLVSGVVGVFFKQLAFVLISTYIISQILAIFLTPIIAYLSLPETPSEEKTRWSDTLAERYIGFLQRSFKRGWISVPIVLFGFLISFLLYKNLPATFLPKWDEGNFVVDIALPVGTSLEESHREFRDIGKIIDSVPEVKGWTLRIGTALGHISEQANIADFLVTMNKERKRSIYEIRDDLYARISARYPNFLEFDIPMVLEDRLGDILGEESPITVLLYGADPDKLIIWGEKVRDALRDVKELEEVNLKTTYASPFIGVKLKSDAEALYGIDINALSAQINSLYWGTVIGDVIKGEKIIGMRVITESPDKDPIEYLRNSLTVYSPKNQRQVPLRYVADVGITENVPEITHYDLSPVSIIAVRFKGNDMTLAVERVRAALTKLNLPQDITPEIAGFYREQQSSFREMVLVVFLSILIMFTALMFQFGSLRLAFIILIGLVLTLLGVFTGLLVTGKPLDITAFMGMLIVLSIVINNNILIFDYYLMQRKAFDREEDAILNAVKTRFRPIFMTMMANVFALLPVALALGTGTQIIQNMAISIMGGLTFAIFVNLFAIPLLMHWWGTTPLFKKMRD